MIMLKYQSPTPKNKKTLVLNQFLLEQEKSAKDSEKKFSQLSGKQHLEAGWNTQQIGFLDQTNNKY